MYPITRLRRNRKASWLRDLLSESTLLVSDLILPIFIIDGVNQKQEIKSMPGIYRLSIDNVLKTAKYAIELGICAIALFPCVDAGLKNENADEAYNIDNLICRCIRALKDAQINIGIICDVALDPYTIHGHDGLIGQYGDIDNDNTINALAKQALVLAKAGADVIAPSDMMDGRIMTIRRVLDEEGFINVNILSYAAKYASNLYGPFRDAVSSNKKIYLDKSTYQMDLRNINEAMREIKYDIEEGADMIMIKPATFYLDVIKQASMTFNINILAYQVSGEYAMLKFASLNGALNWENCLLESLISIKRAGSRAIFTYAAIECAEILRNI